MIITLDYAECGRNCFPLMILAIIVIKMQRSKRRNWKREIIELLAGFNKHFEPINQSLPIFLVVLLYLQQAEFALSFLVVSSIER